MVVDPLLSPNYLTGYFFGLTLELHIFRVVVSLIREYGLLCVKSPLLFTNQIFHCIMLAAGCSVKLIRTASRRCFRSSPHSAPPFPNPCRRLRAKKF